MELKQIIDSLSEEIQYAKNNFIPIIRDKSAEFLYNYVKDNSIKTVLEIGTAIGYSGSIMLGAGAEILETIEIKEKYFNIAKNTFEKMGFLDNVIMHLGDAKDVIKTLCADKKKYDMIFLDGAKGQYIHYLPILQTLIHKEGVIFADNVLLHGLVEGEEHVPHKKRTMVVNLRKYLNAINNYPYETNLIRLEDGIAITKIKGEDR